MFTENEAPVAPKFNHLQRRQWLSLALSLPAALAGCAAPSTVPGVIAGGMQGEAASAAVSPVSQASPASPFPNAGSLKALAPALAPTGALRVGVYLGSPTSLVRSPSGEARGVSVEIGQALATALGVPYVQQEFARLALVLEALKAGQVDFTVTNATPARAPDIDFSETLVALELGLLVPAASSIKALEAMDAPGRRIGVTQGSSSQASLMRGLKSASVAPQASLQAASSALTKGEIDAFATNKAILFEMLATVPGASILPGRWGTEHLAMAIPKGRASALPGLVDFGRKAIASGLVQQAAQRAGLRGTVPVGS